MTDDEPSRGNDQEDIFGVGYDSVVQPNHIECVIAELDDEIWKFARYFDNMQFWSDPAPMQGPPKDVVEHVGEACPHCHATVRASSRPRTCRIGILVTGSRGIPMSITHAPAPRIVC